MHKYNVYESYQDAKQKVLSKLGDGGMNLILLSIQEMKMKSDSLNALFYRGRCQHPLSIDCWHLQ